jgi:capsid assembly protease
MNPLLARTRLYRPWAITRAGWESARFWIEDRLAQELARTVKPTVAAEIQASTRGFDPFGDPIPGMTISGDIATIPVVGIISQDLSGWEKMFGFVDLNDICNEMQMANANPAVTTIRLQVNSPGGSVAGLPEAANLIAESTKRCVAVTDGMICSAAYWLVAGCYSIEATCVIADIGAIGVYQPLIDYSRFYQQSGVDVEILKSGQFKGEGYPGTRMSDAYKQQLQDEVDYIGTIFRSFVSYHRRSIKMSDMQGQSFLAAEAATRGFVDIAP